MGSLGRTLRELDPAAVADGVVESLRAQGLDENGLRADAVLVVTWAQRGGPEEEPALALDRVVRRLFMPPASRRGDALSARVPHPPEEPFRALAMAVMGARGRLRLERLQLIEPRELAALIHVDESWVRALIRAKKLLRDPKAKSPRAAITWASSRPFLVSAGVPPWGPANTNPGCQPGEAAVSRCTTGGDALP